MTLELALIVTVGFAIAGGMPKTWFPEERSLSPETTDSDLATYDVLRTAETQDPVDFGLEWKTPQRMTQIKFGFCSMGGRVYEPNIDASHLEARIAGVWRPVPADLTIDYTQQRILAPIQARGVATWTYRFAPIKADAVRLRAETPAHTDPAYQCIALSSIEATANPATKGLHLGNLTIVGKAPASPEWAKPGADLAKAGTVTRSANTIIRWKRPVMVDSVGFSSLKMVPGIDFEAAVGVWRPVANLQPDGSNKVRFTPVATTGLRVHSTAKCTVHLGQASKDYFAQVQADRSDMLGERFLHAEHRDLAEMNSYLLPIDFTKTAIGRPADLHETLVMWTGTFLMTETAEAKDPQTGAKLPAQSIDRWFAPVASKERFGEDWMSLQSHYLDGWMPSVVTAYRENGLTYRQTVFVTSPDRKLYGNVAIVEVLNESAQPKQGRYAYAMGRRLMYGEAWSPLSQEPLPTGYTIDADRCTVRNEHGAVMLQAAQPGRWEGTPRENLLAYAFKLAPGEKKTLSFLIPSVDAPLKAIPRWTADAELSAFRSWWTKLMDSGAKIDLPETPLNDVYKNQIAQVLIIGLDGDQVRYGAYHYEAYFGVEEGWEAVALAQYGHKEGAESICRFMLAPAQMDKANYHHQYRNGLDPWYATTVARLTQDWDWLKTQMPTIKESAEWTLKVTAENKDAKYGGILPKHVYGGDVGMPAYSFYSNATCFRGLYDTAVALDLMGDKESAARYLEAAKVYRKRILALADSLVDRSSGIPFLSMSFDLDTPSGHREKEPPYAFLASHTSRDDTWGYVGNYWNLFAPLLHEVRLFSEGDERAKWIPKYMEQRGGLLTGLARFDLGIDHVYSKGYTESLLESGRREEFLTSLYGALANGMSRNLYAAPEVSGIFPLRTNNLDTAREHERERWNWFYRYAGFWIAGWQSQEGEPVAASAGMILQLLRMALVREDYAVDPPVSLRLLDGAPTHWFEKGKHVAVKEMRTFLGPVSFRVDSLGDVYQASLSLPAADCVLRLPHPRGLRIVSVTVNGKPWKAFGGNEVFKLRGNVKLEAKFGPGA